VTLGTAVHRLVGFCYPGICASCDGAFPGRGTFCGECLGKLKDLEGKPACDRCCMPLHAHGAPCPRCRGKGLYPYEKVLRLAPFREPLRELVHRMKYRRRWTIAEELADRLIGQGPVKGILTQSEVLVAVPLHWRRQIARGYNQAAVVAGRLGSVCNIEVCRPVRRVRYTETQTHLHAREKREQNLKGAFRVVRPRLVKDRHVVVIDDVMTTGATLQSIGRELKKSGASSVCAIVIAAADPRGMGYEAV